MVNVISSTRIPLTLIPTHLAAFEGARPSYASVYKAVVNAEIPAEQTNGRWFVALVDLPAVAGHFGMTPKSIA